MVQLIIDDPVRLISLGWDSFVKNHPHATVFQSPGMYELFDAAERMQPVVAGIVDEGTGSLHGILLAAIIREMDGVGGYFSSRTVVYGGPLVGKRGRGEEETGRKGEDDMLVDLLLEALIQRVRNKSIFIQFRNFYSLQEQMDAFDEHRFHYRERLNLLTNTSSKEDVIRNMSRSRYRQVKKSLQLGACILKPENIEQVREFYDILYYLYKYKVKKPLPGWDFFRSFYEMSKTGRLGIIRLVKYNDRIIGGILSPVTPGKTIYEWYVCGLDHEYKDLHPSVLATWAAIEYALENNIPQFDFMGVGIPEKPYGVRDFKMRFGGELVNYGRFARINNRMIYFAAETGYNLLALLKKI